jgi:ribosome-binding protein 1
MPDEQIGKSDLENDAATQSPAGPGEASDSSPPPFGTFTPGADDEEPAKISQDPAKISQDPAKISQDPAKISQDPAKISQDPAAVPQEEAPGRISQEEFP